MPGLRRISAAGPACVIGAAVAGAFLLVLEGKAPASLTGPFEDGEWRSPDLAEDGNSTAVAGWTDSARGEGVGIDFVVDRDWVRALHPRVVELEPPGVGSARASDDGLLKMSRRNLDGFVQDSKDDTGPVRRVLMPRRPEDLQLLRLLDLDHLRVEMWPRRGNVHIRVLTDALSFVPNVNGSTRRRSRFASMWPRPRRHWLLLLQATVQLPKGAALLSCTSAWRWAALAGIESGDGGAGLLGSRFRVLEVVCPRRPRGFLLRPPAVDGGHSDGAVINGPWRRAMAGWIRFVFITMLIVACVGQVVLLIACIAMMLLQVVAQRRIAPAV